MHQDSIFFDNDNKYVLVVADVFSSETFASPLMNTDADAVKETLINMTKFVKPGRIISDNEAAFVSKELMSDLHNFQIP